VEEADGGSLQLDAAGQAHYTAPLVNRKRTFHVRATSSFDSRVFGRVALEVRPHAMLAVLEPGPSDPAPVPTLRMVAGNPATWKESAGEPDPWAMGGRFSRPHGLVSVAATGQWLVTYPGNRVFCQFEDPPRAAEHLGPGPECPGAGFCPKVDPRDWGEQVPLACPAHLADNRRPGADWLCAVSEPEQGRIRTVDARGVVRPLAGEAGSHRCLPSDKHRDGPAAQARFRSPVGVAMDGHGTVYVADVGNGALRRIRDGTVSTLVQSRHNPLLHHWAGRESGQPLELPARLNGALALDETGGRLYLGSGHGILAVVLEGERQGQVQVVVGDPLRPGFEGWQADPPGSLAGVPCLFWPNHLAWFRGRLYISDHGNHALRVFDPATGELRTLAGDPGQPHTRRGPLRGGSPHLAPEACAALAFPMGIAFNASGECRVATRDGVVALSGVVEQEAGSGGHG
jgi:hypothetical protein